MRLILIESTVATLNMSKSTAFILLPLFLSSLVNAVTFNCEDVPAGDKIFHLHKLDGPHSVIVSRIDEPPTIKNTTWTVDLCKPIVKPDGESWKSCPSGTRVCGIEDSWNTHTDKSKEDVQIIDVIPIAGEIGGSMDPKSTLLTSKDGGTEGLRIVLNGGSFGGKKQRAVIDLQCDKDRTGNEETEKKSDAKWTRGSEAGDDDEKDKDKTDKDASLTFGSYEAEKIDDKDFMVLKLNWKTKYACADHVDDEEGDGKKSSWGFFTWFILISFLGIATYLIFGSWLNYNRYGARGWDLLPHGDSIRDVPYIFKDFSRKVLDTFTGSGSRGGYSAV